MNTDIIANFIFNTGYEQIEPEAINKAKDSIIDFLGVTLAGSLETAGKLVTEYAREMNGKPEAGVIGKRFKAPADTAALANGTMAHSLDYDDGCSSWRGHPSATILPAILALGEKYQRSGKEVLESYVVGFEIAAIVGLAIARHIQTAGWHPTAILGAIGAASAAAKLLRLGSSETITALGVAASLASGIGQNIGTMTKSLHAGNAARNGILASLLAQKGFTASEAVFDGGKGFCQVFGGDANNEFEKLAQGLGKDWHIISPAGIAFKYYPSCHGTHALIDAALALRKKWNFNNNEIDQVECILGPKQSAALRYPSPQTGLQGKFSIEYCVSLALLEGAVTLKHFTDEKLCDYELQTLLRKVKRTICQSLDTGSLHYFETLLVKLRNGKEYSEKVIVKFSKGEPQNPMTFDELSSKYRECASLALHHKNVQRALDLVSKIEHSEDISALMHVVVFDPD